VNYFAGDVDGAFANNDDDHHRVDLNTVRTWATPYALSIMGKHMTSNCPYGTGEGYGDRRAMSVGEGVSPTTGKRYELQLKGAGQTPFCRGAAGRAVLRISIREFLASETMYHLGFIHDACIVFGRQ